MKDIFISAAGHYLPDKKLDNGQIIEKMLKDSEEYLTKDELDKVSYGHNKKLNFLKARARTTVGEDDTYIQMAFKAAQNAIERSGLKKDQIDGIIAGGITNPMAEPTLAVVLANLLGIETGKFFDISDTCNSFMKSLETAMLYLRSGLCNHMLVLTCESPHEMIKNMAIEDMAYADYKFSNLMLGTGAGAVILSTDGSGKKLARYSDIVYSSNWDASLIHFHDLPLPATRYDSKEELTGFWSDSRKISAQWTQGTADFMKDTVKEWNMDLDSIDKFIFHQLGDNTTFGIMKKANIAKEKAPINTYNEYGNLASANLPVMISIAEKEKIIESGEKVLLVSGGGGFSHSAALINW